MAVEKKQITRTRVSLSCQTCRRRKVKCGKERPICATCQKAGEECVYVDSNQVNGSRQEASNISSRKRHEPDTGFDQQPTEGLNTSVQAMRAMEQKLNQLSALVHDMSRLTPMSNSNSPKEDQHRHFAQTPGFLGKLNATGFGTVERENSMSQDKPSQDDAVLRVLTKLDDLNVMLKSNLKQQMQYMTPSSRTGPETDRVTQGHRGSMLTSTESSSESKLPYEIAPEEIMGPSKEEANVLLRNWLWSVYPIFPLISPSLVLQKYETFRHWYHNDLDKGVPVPDPSFMPFMLVVWITGQNALSERARKKWFPWVQNGPTWYRAICGRVEQYLTIMQTDGNKSIWTIAASLMYHNLTVNGQEIAKGNVQNLLNIRSAQSLGLHNERTITQNGLSEAETRRRIWWEITCADASLSLNSGMPALIEDCYMDTKEISDLKDAWLGSADAKAYEEQVRDDGVQPDPVDDANSNETSSLISVFYLVMKGRLVATQTLRRILRVNMSARQMPMTELKDLRKSIASARKQIEEIINRIPTRGAPEFDFVPVMSTVPVELDHIESMNQSLTQQEIKDFLREHDRSGSSMTSHARTVLSAFHKWARISLSTTLDGLECATYAPFLRNSKSRLWAVSRNCALRVSHSFLRKYLSLAEAADLRRFRWAWPLLFNPMHAAIILLVDLHERPHSDEGPRSRALIDKVFSLSSYEKGVIDFRNWPNTSLPFREGGDEAWMMLRKLRHKAWHKAGLDPDVLWTEEEQMQVGIGKPLSENDLFVRSLREDIIMSHNERLDRLNTNKGTDPDLSQMISQRIRNEAVKQYMHPSQVGPGERVTGSITHNMVDWDTKELPSVLLLRAQQDQEMMPFPPTAQISNTIKVTQTGIPLFGAPKHDEGKKEGEISHLGDLIRKIKQTKIDHLSDNTKPSEPLLPTGDPIAEPSAEQDTVCTFRTQQKVMNTVFEELAERHTTSGTAPIYDKPTIGARRLDGTSFTGQYVPIEETPRFRYFPVAPAPTMRQHGTQGIFDTPNSTLNDTSGIGCVDQCSSAFVDNENIASNVTHHENATQNVSTESFSIDSPAAFRSSGAGHPNTLDFDFNWARWDEMYGATEGFEDMMMDLASEELQNAEVNHAGSAHGW